ncbi:2249_t:CDS:2 [Diversispora eburnea]|uniref:2249_t:CDS:1 n=1 Tax=Diversispora eburnea TaxID=1213867 RepID=A0A9N9GJQ6_9GLOM|nr:2249_t:CDS:2 [Diversispora eburnea]
MNLRDDRQEKYQDIFVTSLRDDQQNETMKPDEIELTKSQYIEQGLIKELLSDIPIISSVIIPEYRPFQITIQSLDLGITDKTARTQLYKEILSYLLGITLGNLHMKTLRAKKIQMLFGKYGVGIEKIKQVTYN